MPASIRRGPFAAIAFGAERVQVTDNLLADDYAGGRLNGILDEHRRLMAEPVPNGANRVLVGHRTPAIMVLGSSVGGRAFPEGAALGAWRCPSGARHSHAGANPGAGLPRLLVPAPSK